MNINGHNIELHDFNGVQFPYPTEALNIGVKMSGGIDSATIMYALAWLRANGKIHSDTQLFSITGINWQRPYQEQFVNRTIDYINKSFNCDIPYTYTMEGGGAGQPDLDDATNQRVKEVSESENLHIKYTGISKFLPDEYIDDTEFKNSVLEGKYDPSVGGWKYKTLLDITDTDNTKYNHNMDMRERLWSAPERPNIIPNHNTIHPWFNYHKGHVKTVSDTLDVTDDLLSITRSCEHHEILGKQFLDFSFHCGECYWCVERLVTYGKLE